MYRAIKHIYPTKEEKREMNFIELISRFQLNLVKMYGIQQVFFETYCSCITEISFFTLFGSTVLHTTSLKF